MTSYEEQRTRPAPSERFAGPEHHLHLDQALAFLRKEPQTTRAGHLQMTLLHRASVRLVLFAFESGGKLPQHSAPGVVTIHLLRGRMRVRTPSESYDLGAGDLLTLERDVPHDVEALEECDMLLGVHPETPPNASAL